MDGEVEKIRPDVIVQSTEEKLCSWLARSVGEDDFSFPLFFLPLNRGQKEKGKKKCTFALSRTFFRIILKGRSPQKKGEKRSSRVRGGKEGAVLAGRKILN